MRRRMLSVLCVCLAGLMLLIAFTACSGDKNNSSSNSSGISDFMQVGKQYLLSGYSANQAVSAVTKVLEIKGEWIRVEIVSSAMMLDYFEWSKDRWDDLWVNTNQVHMIATNPSGDRW